MRGNRIELQNYLLICWICCANIRVYEIIYFFVGIDEVVLSYNIYCDVR